MKRFSRKELTTFFTAVGVIVGLMGIWILVMCLLGDSLLFIATILFIGIMFVAVLSSMGIIHGGED